MSRKLSSIPICHVILSAVALFLFSNLVRAFQVPRSDAHSYYHRRIRSSQTLYLAASASEDDDGDVSEEGDDELDWRAFRARLIQTEQQDSSSSQSASAASMDNGSWAYDAGMNVEVGTVLVSIPTKHLCQALEQQYFHRCVVLVTQCDDEGVRGILLNRPTGFAYKSGEKDYEWCLSFGGDMYEDHIDDDTEIICLHSLKDPKVKAVSKPIEPGLSYTNLAEARRLVNDGVAKQHDFWCFGGHCKWYPGQLEKEMGPERGEWLALSLDAATIWNELRQHAHSPDMTGVDMWKHLVDRLEKNEEAVSRLPRGQLRFYDRMLRAWVTSNLVIASNDSRVGSNETATSEVNIGPGTLVRATLKGMSGFPCPPFLLHDQDFHRSIVLVLDDNVDATIGLHLNLPLSGVIQVSEDIIIPIRYGGPTGPPEENDDDETFVWIHRSPNLSKVGEGTPLGDSGCWKIEEDDAIEALQSGEVSPKDIMIFSGICVWEKGEDMGSVGGGLKEQIEMQAMEIVPTNKASILWRLLAKQDVLTNETLHSNLSLAIAAWEACDTQVEHDEATFEQSGPDSDIVLLADTALRAWAAVTLLDEPTTTLIEVPEG